MTYFANFGEPSSDEPSFGLLASYLVMDVREDLPWQSFDYLSSLCRQRASDESDLSKIIWFRDGTCVGFGQHY